MASISTYLAKILSAIYGEEVRGSIHDAISAINDESETAMKYASDEKDSAAAYAAAAKTSQTAAASSASAAKTSETNAASSADAAAASAAAAKASEINAKASETAAASSAETAKQYSGNPPQPINGTWWIWNAATGQYENSGISCAAVSDISLTSGDHSPGCMDIYTVTMTDGTTYLLSVYNGRNADGAGDVRGISFDLTLPISDWRNGTIEVSDSRLLASDTYTYIVAADDNSLTEYTNYNVHPKHITADGVITFVSDLCPTADLTVKVIRFEFGVSGELKGDVLGTSFDLTLPVSDWQDGTLRVVDSHLMAFDMYTYIVAADDDSWLEYTNCNVRPKHVTDNGVMTFLSGSNPSIDLTVKVTRFELGVNAA